MDEISGLMKRGLWSYVLALLVFLFVGLGTYSNVINAFFLSDDFVLIAAVKDNGAFGLWSHDRGEFFRPLISLSLFADSKLWGLNPLGHHVTNLVVHSLNSVLVSVTCYLLIRKARIFTNDLQILPLLSGLAFLLLASHTEAVTWISGRTDVIATFFGLFSFGTYLLYRQCSRRPLFLFSAVLFICALLSKESVITYPFVILAYELYVYVMWKRQSTELVNALRMPLVHFALVGVYFLARLVATGSLVGAGYLSDRYLRLSLWSILKNLIKYPARVLMPPVAIGKLTVFAFLISMVMLFVTSALKSVRKGSGKGEDRATWLLLCFLMIAFLMTVLPVLSLQIATMNTGGERFLYWPSAFVCILITTLLRFAVASQRRFVLLSCCLLVLSSISLYRVNETWRTGGQISKQLIEDIVALPKADTVLITNLPEVIVGVPVYRAGQIEGVRLFCGDSQFSNIVALAHHNIFSEGDGIVVQQSRDGYSVQLLAPGTRFWYFAGSPSIPEHLDIVVTDVTATAFKVQVKGLTKHDHLLFYSAGNLHRVE